MLSADCVTSISTGILNPTTATPNWSPKSEVEEKFCVGEIHSLSSLQSVALCSSTWGSIKRCLVQVRLNNRWRSIDRLLSPWGAYSPAMVVLMFSRPKWHNQL